MDDKYGGNEWCTACMLGNSVIKQFRYDIIWYCMHSNDKIKQRWTDMKQCLLWNTKKLMARILTEISSFCLPGWPGDMYFIQIPQMASPPPRPPPWGQHASIFRKRLSYSRQTTHKLTQIKR